MSLPPRYIVFTALFSFLSLCIQAQQDLLSIPYQPSAKNGTIEFFLQDMEKKTGVSISYSNAVLDVNEKVFLQGNENTIETALTSILSNKEVYFQQGKKKILIVAKKNKTKTSIQSYHTINGFVKDRDSKEVIIGAVVYEPVTQTAISTNNFGFYSLSLPKGKHTIIVMYVSYQSDTLTVQLNENTYQDILLKGANTLSEVTIKKNLEKDPNSTHLLTQTIYSQPSLAGETDIMRTIQNIPGVQSGVDGLNTIMVRGGDPGQNLSLLDGVPVYYTDHFFGLTSIFNSEAIKSVDFYKGAFPARFGGRLSSIIDVNTKDGDMSKWGGQFTMGLLKATLNAEGPLIKEKASVMIAARRTWLDALTKPVDNSTKVNFYDLNTKVNYIINNKNRIYLSFYNGRDKFATRGNMNSDIGSKWGNTIVSARWNTVVNPKFFVNSTVTYSQFKSTIFQNGIISDTSQGLPAVIENRAATSIIKDVAVRIRAHWYANANHKIETGIKYAFADYLPISVENKINNNNSVNYTTFFHADEITLFAEDEITASEKWSIRPGLHWANWINKGSYYSSIQPRLSLEFTPHLKHKLYGGVALMTQFLHYLNNTNTGFQSDFLLPSTDRIAPEDATVVNIGYAYADDKALDCNLEFYYKDIQNITMYRPGADVFDYVANWEDNLIQGNGWSYGLEYALGKQAGRFHFTTAYTLSWTYRLFDNLNNGKPFPYRYDRRHNIRMGLNYGNKSKKFVANVSWIFMSGEAITIPDQVYGSLDGNVLMNPNGFNTGYDFSYEKLNDYRLPPIHRLDFNLDFNKHKKKSYRTWSFGVFNAYGRKNIMFVTLLSENGEFSLMGASFLRFVPYFSYRIKF